MGRRPGLVIDATRLIKLRDAQGWSQERLAQLAGVATRVVWKAENGGGVDAKSLRDICVVTTPLGLTYENLVRVEATFKTPGDVSSLTEAEQARILQDVVKRAGLLGGLLVKTIEDGCIKFTVTLSLEDAQKLEAAFKDGKLAPLNVLSVEVPSRRGWLRHAPSRRAASLCCSAASLLCGVVAFLPVWRVPCLVLGGMLGLTGGVLGRKNRPRLAIAVLAMAANGAGWAYWLAPAPDNQRNQNRINDDVAKSDAIKQIQDLLKDDDDGYPDLETALKAMREARDAAKGIWVWRDAADGDKSVLDEYGFIPEVAEKWRSHDPKSDRHNVAEIAKIGGIPGPLRLPDAINLITGTKYGPGYWTFIPDTNYQYPPGPQHLRIKSGNEVVFEGDVLVPEKTTITTKITFVMGKKVLTFSPDIRVMKN